MAKAKPQGKVVAAAKGKGKGAGGAGGVGGSKATNKANDKKRITPKKPKARVQRLLKKREPQLVEGGKCALLMRGTRCPDELKSVLKDLTMLLKPNAKMLNRKNEMRPFEDVSSLEFLLDKNECGLFAVGTHSKKRPLNLILGRTYDKHVLDMVEFGVSSVAPLESFKGVEKKRLGSKPCVVFAGENWEHDATLQRVRNLFTDFFRVEDVKSLALAGLDSAAVFTAMGDKAILVRNYHIKFKKSGERVPNVLLEAMGPCFTLTLRRQQLAAPDLWRTACKQPRELQPRKVKNESRNVLGDTLGRIHLGRQDLSSMRVKRVKALRRTRGDGEDGEEDADGEGDAAEEGMDESSGGEEDEEDDGSD